MDEADGRDGRDSAFVAGSFRTSGAGNHELMNFLPPSISRRLVPHFTSRPPVRAHSTRNCHARGKRRRSQKRKCTERKTGHLAC